MTSSAYSECYPCPPTVPQYLPYTQGSPAIVNPPAEYGVPGSTYPPTEDDRAAESLSQPVPSAAQPSVVSAVPSTDFFASQAASPVAQARETFVPNMISDTSSGGCGGIRLGEALVATLDHPTYACSRLNIAENNSPMLRDRVYYTYRHFHNASSLDFFSYSPQGRAGDFNIDQHVFGLEKRLAPCLSVEIRAPINSQLGSDLTFAQMDSGGSIDGNNNLDEILRNGTDTSFGNLALILKTLLYCDPNGLYVSGGLGINIPTAPDLRIGVDVNDPNYQIYDPSLSRSQNTANGPLNGPVPTGELVRISGGGVYRNQTVNLQPFLAFVNAPNDISFCQGFLQVDVPLNKSSGSIAVNYQDPIASDSVEGSDSLAQQTLIRANFGFGCWLLRSMCGRCRRASPTGLAAMLELHYTATLNGPDREVASIFAPLFGTYGLPSDIDIELGQLANSVNSLNLVGGLPLTMENLTIYNGFSVPLRDGFDRGFDFEYSLSVDRRF